MKLIIVVHGTLIFLESVSVFRFEKQNLQKYYGIRLGGWGFFLKHLLTKH